MLHTTQLRFVGYICVINKAYIRIRYNSGNTAYIKRGGFMKNISLRHHLCALFSSGLFRAVLFCFFLVLGIGVVVQPAQADTRIVTNTLDSGSGSLRQVVSDALSSDVIVFDPAVFNAPLTITLTSGQIVIDKRLTIDGAAGNVYTPTVSGNNVSRVFWVGPSLDVTLNRLNIVNGISIAMPTQAVQASITRGHSPLRTASSSAIPAQIKSTGGGIYNDYGGNDDHC